MLKAKHNKQRSSNGLSYRWRRTKLRDRMDPEQKQEEKKECLTGYVITTTEGGTDWTNQTIKCAEKGKTSANNSWESPELPGNA